METGISTACFFPLETEKTIHRIKAMGFRKIEVFLQAESEYSIEYIKKLKESISENGLTVTSVHGFCSAFEPYIFSEYHRRSGDSIKLFEKVARAGELLGAKYYSFHGNRIEATTDSFNYHAFAKTMQTLAEYACEHGLTLAWENVCWCQSGDPEFLKRALHFLDMEHLGFTLDIKQAYRKGILPNTYIEIMGQYIKNVHINDWSPSHSCLLPGVGEADYSSIFSALKNVGYSGDFIIEVYRNNFKFDEEIIKSKEIVEKYIKSFFEN